MAAARALGCLGLAQEEGVRTPANSHLVRCGFLCRAGPETTWGGALPGFALRVSAARRRGG